MAKHLVTSQLLGCNNYLCDFVSQNNGVTCPVIATSAPAGKDLRRTLTQV